jgi:hypothetical protein
MESTTAPCNNTESIARRSEFIIQISICIIGNKVKIEAQQSRGKHENGKGKAKKKNRTFMNDP